MLCNKISKNPQKGFLQSLGRGINEQNQKTNIFSNITQVFFCPMSWNFTTDHSGDSCFLSIQLMSIQLMLLFLTHPNMENPYLDEKPSTSYIIIRYVFTMLIWGKDNYFFREKKNAKYMIIS